jgi:hypothetical protein
MNDSKGWLGQRGQAGATGRFVGVRAWERPAARRRARPDVQALEDRRLLALVIPVTSPEDSGLGTLRDAVAKADQADQPVEIQFHLVKGTTIALTSGQLELSNFNEPVAVEGPGNDGLTIDGTGKGRVFQVDPNVTASISGLTVTGGTAAGSYGAGGDLLNQGTLTMTSVTARGGTAYEGGDLFNVGTESLDDCTLSGGTANRGAGLFDYGTTMLVGCSVTGNVGVPYGGNSASLGAGITFYGSGLTMIGGLISGNSSSRASAIDVYASYGTVNITGTTISGNPCNYDMIYNGSTKMTLTGCTISGGSSPSVGGPGVVNLLGQLTLVDCSVEDFQGRGIVNQDGTLQATGSRIINNNGGALWNVDFGHAQLTDCTISGNTVSGQIEYGAAGVDNGIWSDIALTYCTISGNRASPTNGKSPGAVVAGGFFSVSNATLIGCTISGNSTTGLGGGLYSDSATTLTDTIVASNTASGGASDIAGLVTGSYNLIGTGGSGGLTAANHNLLNVANSGMAPLGDYGGPTETMALLPGSPAIHNGTAVPGVIADQRGFAVDSPPDIGAFQSHPGPLVVDTAIDGLGSGLGQLSLRQAVDLADVLTGGATITFDKSAFARPSVITLTAGQLELSNATGSVKIVGPGLGKLAVSGGGVNRVFQVDKGASASLSGLTITGGFTTGDGGGLLNQGKVILSGDAIVGNSAADGGGIANSGTATILGSSIDGNAAWVDGGGIFNTGSLDLILSDLSGNTAGTGGGLFNRGTAALVFCTVDDNAAAAGGGIYADRSGQPVVLIGTEVKRNKGGNISGRVVRL